MAEIEDGTHARMSRPEAEALIESIHREAEKVNAAAAELREMARLVDHQTDRETKVYISEGLRLAGEPWADCTLCGKWGPVTEALGVASEATSVLYKVRSAACQAWSGGQCADCAGAGCYDIDVCAKCDDLDDIEHAMFLMNRVLRAKARGLGWKVNTDGGRTKLTDPSTKYAIWFETHDLKDFLAFTDGRGPTTLPPNFLAVHDLKKGKKFDAGEFLRLAGEWTADDHRIVASLHEGEEARLNSERERLIVAGDILKRYGVETLGEVPGWEEGVYLSDAWREHAQELLAAAPAAD